MVTFSDLTLAEHVQLFGYLCLPILIFGLLLYFTIVLSNRLGGQNKLLVFFARLILSGGVIAGLAYYFYYFATVILVS